jgi:phage head maturation protease
MDVHLEVPEALARQLASNADDLARVALEALAADGVRSRKLSVHQARELLCIRSRYEMDGFLKKHGVFLDLTLEDVQNDSDAALAMNRCRR